MIRIPIILLIICSHFICTLENTISLIKTEDLAPGWYRLTETKAPENYELNPKPETFCITAGMHLLGQGWESWQNDNAPEKVRKNIENVPYGSLTLQKEYRSAKGLTKGETRAVFGLYTKEEKEYQEFQTLTCY